MVNIRDVARETNYSVSTISKAFSNSTDISDETRKIIIEAARKMGYNFKNARKKKGKILVLTNRIDALDRNEFGYELIFSFTVAAYNAGYNVTVESEEDDPESSYEKRIADGGYAGGFVIGYTQEELARKGIQKCSIPTIALDNFVNNPFVSCIGSDNERGMAMAVEHLTKLGHRKIAVLTGERDSFVARVRKRAFTLVMQNMHLPCPDELCAYSDFRENRVAPFIDRFLENGATAIVCASDRIALYAIEYLHRKQLRVPEDISVVGYDNAPIASQTKPLLTTIDQNAADIGKNAMFVLLQSLSGTNISKLLLRPKLISRESTAEIAQ